MVDLSGITPLRKVQGSQRSQAQSLSSQPPASKNELAGKSLPQLVNMAGELASGPPPVDRERIAQVRAAISSGTYRIDPEQIARTLLGDKQ